MLEAVFGRSAAGSVKTAQHCDGAALGGSPGDVFCFEDDFSMGDISGDSTGPQRMKSLGQLFSAFPQEQCHALEAVQHTADVLDALARRAAEGEPVRIWYSAQPMEACGLSWLIARLAERIPALPAMIPVELPQLVRRGDTLVQYRGWGEVLPEELAGFAAHAQQATPAFLMMARARWQELQQQNAPLRAGINGRLQSVGEDFYDPFLLRELATMPEKFCEANLIGAVMGRYQLGIGDLWLALRIEAMIARGLLAPVQEPCPGEGYRRMLKKTGARRG